MYEFDDTTNLPVVPDGYFWSVDVYWGPYDKCPSVTVQLRKKKRFGSKIVSQADGWLGVREDYETMNKLDPSEYPAAIQEYAEKVMVKNEQQLRDEVYYARFGAAKKKLSGQYPPKRLENN